MTFTPTQIRLAAWTALTLAAVLVLALLAPVLSPFVLGAVLAYAWLPLVDRWAGWGVPRWAGALLALGLMAVLVLAVALLIVPVITQQIPLLREQVPTLLEGANAVLAPWAQRMGVPLQIDVAMVREWFSQLVSGHESEWFERAFASLRIGGSALLALLGNVVLAPMVRFICWSIGTDCPRACANCCPLGGCQGWTHFWARPMPFWASTCAAKCW
jgi:predicted PurR-regulated permease PerM